MSGHEEDEGQLKAGTEPQGRQKRYSTTWRNKFLCTHTTSYDEFLATLAVAVATLADWKVQGVLFDPDGGTCDDYATFYTYDAALAEKLGFLDEDELYGHDDDDDENEDGENGDGEQDGTVV